MSADRWNWLRTCSTSFSEHEETLVFATIRGDSVRRIGSSAAITLAPRGGCRATDAWGDSTGLASATREAGSEGESLEATASKDSKVGWSAAVAGEGFIVVFFLFPFYTIRDGGRLVVKEA